LIFPNGSPLPSCRWRKAWWGSFHRCICQSVRRTLLDAWFTLLPCVWRYIFHSDFVAMGGSRHSHSNADTRPTDLRSSVFGRSGQPDVRV
jgi:hypothetical protein